MFPPVNRFEIPCPPYRFTDLKCADSLVHWWFGDLYCAAYPVPDHLMHKENSERQSRMDSWGIALVDKARRRRAFEPGLAFGFKSLRGSEIRKTTIACLEISGWNLQRASAGLRVSAFNLRSVFFGFAGFRFKLAAALCRFWNLFSQV